MKGDIATPKVLVVAFDVFEKSTRARKYCRVYAAAGADVQYLGMSNPGRSGRWGKAGDSTDGGVAIHQVAMRPPAGGVSKKTQVTNLARSYVPALTRMARYVWGHPADTVHVVGAPLSPLGMLHKLRHRGRFVLDVQERPGAVATPGSLSSVFAHVERLILNLDARFTDAATVVTPPDVAALEEFGFRNVQLVRNAPLKSWRTPYRPPTSPRTVTTFACIGTIFEGRAFEALIQATAIAAREVPIRLQISGTGSAEYVDELKNLADECGASPYIDWLGWVSAGEVCDRYLDADVGLVLYDTTVSGNDGLSNKIMECVAAGRPVLCTDAPLNTQFVDELQVGWTTPSTVEGLSGSLRAAASEMDLTQLAAHCRNVGDRSLTWESECHRLIDQPSTRIP